MKKLHVKATFIEPVLGTWPANPNVAREFIASKSPDAATIEDEVAALGPDKDIQMWFRVSSRNNIPRKRFDEAVEYIQRWKPSTNTVMLIQQTNGQTSLFAAAAAQKNTTTAGKFVKEV